MTSKQIMRRGALGLSIAVACAITFAGTEVVVRTTVLGQSPSPMPSPTPDHPAFTVRAGSSMLLQIRDGLQTRNTQRMLAPFDLSRMPDAQLFEQQLRSFFSHTETIRVHLNLVNATTDHEKGFAEVNAEMEADLGDNVVPLHKQARLKFSAVLEKDNWRLVDVQPRSFFSTQP